MVIGERGFDVALKLPASALFCNTDRRTVPSRRTAESGNPLLSVLMQACWTGGLGDLELEPRTGIAPAAYQPKVLTIDSRRADDRSPLHYTVTHGRKSGQSREENGAAAAARQTKMLKSAANSISAPCTGLS